MNGDKLKSTVTGCSTSTTVAVHRVHCVPYVRTYVAALRTQDIGVPTAQLYPDSSFRHFGSLLDPSRRCDEIRAISRYPAPAGWPHDNPQCRRRKTAFRWIWHFTPERYLFAPQWHPGGFLHTANFGEETLKLGMKQFVVLYFFNEEICLPEHSLRAEEYARAPREGYFDTLISDDI